jgi:hypothetical protein
VGIESSAGSVTLRDLTIAGFDVAVQSAGRLSISRASIGDSSDTGVDLVSSSATLVLSHVQLSGEVATAGDVLVNDVALRGKLQSDGDVRGAGVLLLGNGATARNIFLRDVFPEPGPQVDTAGAFYALERFRLVNGVVDGNEHFRGRPDIVSGRRPELTRVVCGRSGHVDDVNESWGVCRDD